MILNYSTYDRLEYNWKPSQWWGKVSLWLVNKKAKMRKKRKRLIFAKVEAFYAEHVPIVERNFDLFYFFHPQTKKKIFLLFSSQNEEREMENKSFSTNMFFFAAVKTAKCGRHVTSEDLCFWFKVSDFFSAELWPLDKREDFWIYSTWNKNCISRFKNSVSWQFLQCTFVESIFTWKSLWMEDCKEQKFASCQSLVLFSAFLRIFLLMLRRFFDGTE